MKSRIPRFHRNGVALSAGPGLCVLTLWSVLFGAAPAWSQPAPLLVTSVQATSDDTVHLVFSDGGAGATNYWVEASVEVGPAANWRPAAATAIIEQGGGIYSVQIAAPENGVSFYRVAGLGGAIGPVTIRFSDIGYFASEGDEVLALLTLDRSFSGAVHYRIEGTGANPPLSGQLQVNGASAVIPVSLTENAEIGELKHLNLVLEPGPGYEVGLVNRTTLTVDENDALWEGQFLGSGGSFPFGLTLIRTGTIVTGWLQSGESGFFPTNEMPATVTFDSERFTAVVAGIQVRPEATLLNSPIEHTLELRASNTEPDQSVSAGRIDGLATLITRVPALPQLDTTNQGSFLLLKSQGDAQPTRSQVAEGRGGR